MKLGPIVWGIILFGALAAAVVTVSHQPGFDTADLDQEVTLRSPGFNLMIATAWADDSCCCETAAGGLTVTDRAVCEDAAGRCAAVNECDPARREAQMSFMSRP